MANIILSKESSNNELKGYFEAVLKLAQSANEFPINLNDVWMLVYSEKSKAVRALKKDFIEGIDYHLAQNGKGEVFAQNGENSKGGRPSEGYYLSTSCLEYFIARKVRPVFEVYRQVFHKAVQKPSFDVNEKIRKYDNLVTRVLKQTEDGLKLIKKLEDELWEQKARVVIETEKKEAEAHVKNSMMSFLIQMKLYEKWQKYEDDARMKETIKRLKAKKEADDLRPYELPF